MQIIATALTTVHPNQIIQYIKDYLQKEEIETFVVGMPKQLDGTDSQSAMHVKGFIRSLKKSFPAIEAVAVDERFTSKMASATIAQSGLKRAKRQEKGLIDTISAVIILQSYMERKRF